MTDPVPGGEAPRTAAAPTVLVANRGEIAVRVIRTLRRLGMRSVAVYSDADPEAPHVRAADTAVRIGGATLSDSYLNGAAIVDAAVATGATLVHPGYGFLSENAGFARSCAEAGLVFVGPPAEAIEAMGDKIRAKATVEQAGVPLLPGFAEKNEQPMTDTELLEAAAVVGYPLLIKPSAGGGGKGMRLVREEGELAGAAATARREARAAFGDATLLVERFVERPRHIEVQVLADAHGNVVHLGERECSLQRRHQKIVEEAPSPLLSPTQRSAMGAAAVAAARACGYVGAGTVEFIVRGTASADEPPGTLDYSFLEMNTRLQVEHPVTEAVTTIGGTRGIDLVELQLRVALGEQLPFAQEDVGVIGHAVECRVYAEDPARDFLPTGGQVLLLAEPTGPDVRVDSGLDEGSAITSAYDPMLAKVVVWDTDRAGALRRAGTALSGYTVLGCGVNVAFLRALLSHPEVVAGRLSTDLTERLRPELTAGTDRVPDAVLAAVALDHQLGLEPTDALADRFDVPDGWRVGEHAWTSWRLRAPGQEAQTVRVRRSGDGFEVAVGDAVAHPATARRRDSGRTLVVAHSGRIAHYARAVEADTVWLGLDGASWQLRRETLLAPMRSAAVGIDGTVRSPMPGTVLAVPVAQGATVHAGDAVVVVEAMKMEHSVTAPIDGLVTSLSVHPGQSVAMDTVLAVITAGPSEIPEGSSPVTTTKE
ncbi:acetyl/propionyl/methylcrotonyl-CoA carboxylase subunit alpha [Nocardiopsis ansamitocini]|uniref:biotin carboxylase n=1 Tax=Nocardiopsis ansamitocini TaxID=1670832 RepID=A0A9W6P2R5_9ACTN|nr:biotin carboxylase N-terminal domain-containing protein [Nocardiopsis ansamitocini]GLU46195.1 acetyl/propionyl-CoA carboxylase subuit alpha [Nocardiopsis ansamitocini]